MSHDFGLNPSNGVVEHRFEILKRLVKYVILKIPIFIYHIPFLYRYVTFHEYGTSCILWAASNTPNDCNVHFVNNLFSSPIRISEEFLEYKHDQNIVDLPSFGVGYSDFY